MDSSAEYYSKGNEAFVAEDYALASELYSKAIDLEENCADYYLNRAHAYLKLEKYKESKEDADKAKALGCLNPKLHLRKGIACFHLDEFEDALDSFKETQKLDASDNSISEWLQKCEDRVHLKTEPLQPILPVKIRHEWYQTEPYVFISILLKKVNEEDIKVTITARTLNCNVKLKDNEDFKLDLNLAHEIVPGQSSWKVLATKVEIKLKKSEGIHWGSLEAQPTQVKHFISEASAQDTLNRYPSSSSKQKDWDKIVFDIGKEEADEKVQGEAAVNQLFQKIYAEGSEDVKRAMNKSFTESGGTVLSTNWSEVSSKRVEVKPPDGMEWKHWED